MTNDLQLKNAAGLKAKKAPKRRKSASLDRKRSRAGWFFTLPFILGFLLIYLPIIIDSLKYSFCYTEYVTGYGYKFTSVGFNNYIYAFTGANSTFAQVLVTGLKEMVFNIPAIILFSLFMAVLLNQKMVGRAAFRAIFFIPVIMSTGILETVSTTLQQSMEGSINDGSGGSASEQIVSAMDLAALFENMKVGTGLVEVVAQIINNIYDIVNHAGVQMLIFLAGLQSISPAIYESCQIDGATGWETFWKITFPMISPMILVNAVYTVIDEFTSSSNTVMAYVNNVADSKTPFEINGVKLSSDGLASAMSWLYFLIVILIIAAVAGICSAFVFYQRRDR